MRVGDAFLGLHAVLELVPKERPGGGRCKDRLQLLLVGCRIFDDIADLCHDRPGLGHEILILLLIVHSQDRREILDDDACIANVLAAVLDHGPAAILGDAPCVLEIAPEVVLSVLGSDQSVAIDARVPDPFERQVVRPHQLVAQLERVPRAFFALEPDR